MRGFLSETNKGQVSVHEREFVCVGIIYSVTCVSSMVTISQCAQYQFSPVASLGQEVKLHNSLADDKHHY